MNIISRWWKSLKVLAREALDEIPPIDVLWRERKAYANALRVLGDEVARMEPEQIADIEYVRYAARIVQFVAGTSLKGADKATLVIERVRAAWRGVGIADTVFDTWWESIGRPFLDAYCAEAKAADAWVKP